MDGHKYLILILKIKTEHEMERFRKKYFEIIIIPEIYIMSNI